MDMMEVIGFDGAQLDAFPLDLFKLLLFDMTPIPDVV